MNRCRLCAQENPRSGFRPKAIGVCRACESERRRHYRSNPAYKETRRKWRAKWIAKPENQKLERKRQRRYLASVNPQRFLKQKESHQRYRRTEKGKAAAARDYARRSGWIQETDHPLTAPQWLEILKASRFRCFYCKKKVRLTIDHVTPLSRGGQHVAENIVPACRNCNARKRDRIVMLL